MGDAPIRLTLEELYGAWNAVPNTFWETLDHSHSPRSREMLYDKMAALDCAPGHHVLDIGCWAGKHSCELARRFGCRVEAVDYIPAHVEQAGIFVEAQGLADLVKASQGDIHALGFPDGEFDFIWCRDMLPNVRDIRRAFVECSRVLKPGGKMVVFTDLETELMEPREAARLYGDAMWAESMSPGSVESAIRSAGLVILERDEVAAEFTEWDEEKGGDVMATEFLRIARMMRSRDMLVTRFGRTLYEAELTGSLWYAYEVLGKIMPVVYVLSK